MLMILTRGNPLLKPPKKYSKWSETKRKAWDKRHAETKINPLDKINASADRKLFLTAFLGSIAFSAIPLLIAFNYLGFITIPAFL